MMNMMMKLLSPAAGLRVAVLAWIAGAWPAPGAPTLRLGTLAPEGTSYHKSLLEMREKWRKAPGGGVELKIYAGGKLGGDAKMVSQMRLGALDAGLLTAAGLVEIERACIGLQTAPMLFNSLEEVDQVGARLQPMLEKRMEKQGFVTLFWGDTGWVRFFSKQPMLRPDDGRKMKIFTWAGDPVYAEVWKAAGFQAVPLETSDIVPMLDTGLINVTPMPPFLALASQVYDRAPHMLELNWAPLIGALVVRKAAWEKIPAGTRAELARAALESGKAIKAFGRAEGDKAVEAMKAKGLAVHQATPEIEAEWRAAVEAVHPKIRGAVVPEEVFDEVLRLIKEIRADGSKKP
jgi:TRAP-type C4-dicarboxylate transport system substrate-binding protein